MFSSLFLGRGGRKGALEVCPSCRGSGVQVRLHQLGFGMVQQVSTMCCSCQGQGQRMSHRDRCKTCTGRKILRQKKILEVHIDKGWGNFILLGLCLSEGRILMAVSMVIAFRVFNVVLVPCIQYLLWNIEELPLLCVYPMCRHERRTEGRLSWRR